jgi:hypothetical protein
MVSLKKTFEQTLRGSLSIGLVPPCSQGVRMLPPTASPPAGRSAVLMLAQHLAQQEPGTNHMRVWSRVRFLRDFPGWTKSPLQNQKSLERAESPMLCHTLEMCGLSGPRLESLDGDKLDRWTLGRGGPQARGRSGTKRVR